MLDDAEDWIEEHPNAKTSEIQEQKKDYDEKVNPIIKKATARRDLSDLSKNVRDRLKDTDDSLSHLSKEDRKRIKDASDELEKWLKDNPDATEEEINKKKKRI